jgi:hypothetical protein
MPQQTLRHFCWSTFDPSSENAERFSIFMNAAAAECVLISVAAEDRGFFNNSSFCKGNRADFDLTMKHSIKFLKAYDILK